MKRLPHRFDHSTPLLPPFEVSSQQRSGPRLPWKTLAYLIAGMVAVFLTVWVVRPAPLRVEVGRVERGELQVTVDAEGQTRVRDRFVIGAGVDGYLARIVLDAGDRVTAGMVVAQMDPLPLQASVQEALGQLAEWRQQRAGVGTFRPKAEAVEQARVRIRAAEAQYRQAEARVAEAQAALEQARRDRQRAQQLEADGAISRQDREVAELEETTRARTLDATLLAARASAAEVEVARAELAVVQQEQMDPDYLLGVYDARIASTEAELSRLRDEAARTDIRSPVDGTVLRIHQKDAQFVTRGTPLLEVGNPSQLELVIDVLSTDAVQIKPGDVIWVDRDPGKAPLQARVRLLEPSAFTEVSALGVEEQRVNVIGDFVEPAPSLGDGYRIDTHIVVWRGEDVLKVPISALFRCELANWCVFVVDEGKAYPRAIAIGHRSDRDAELQQGLQPGEQVILYPTEQIQAGVRVISR